MLPYLDELARLLDRAYDDFVCYASVEQLLHSTQLYICKRCFVACEKGLMQERKLVDICETISSSQRSPVKPKRPRSSSECDRFE